ncbi:MAG TPA: DUF3515 domain-containing protein [Nocardioides sp.]|nr:DUF3515 domain-containing protein [Nocardioides sp.]
MASRRPGPPRVRGAATSGLVAALLLTGCGEDPVTISAPEVRGSERATCERFVADLPDELADETRRTLADDQALGAAWGDPPIVLTCGGALPDDFDRFAQCVEANGVGWFVPPEAETDQSSSATLTAAGYRPLVRVAVPEDYRPEGVAAIIAELAGPVREHLELVDPCE